MNRMAKTKQNKVPSEFDSLYSPIVQLKKILQSKTKELAPNEALHGIIMLHFATFVMLQLRRRVGVETVKELAIRSLVESVLATDSYHFQNHQISSLFSFIDALAKALNTTAKPYVYIAMYQAYLDAEIYRNFHSDLGIYDFVELQSVRPDTVAAMKHYHDASVLLIGEVSARAKERRLINVETQ